MAKPSESGRAEPADATNSRLSVWRALAILGLIVGAVGLIEVADGWRPLRLGNAYWLYRVAGGTIDGLSLTTAAVIALAASLIALRSTRALRVLGVFIALLLVAAGAAYALFLSSLPRVRTMAAAANDLPSLRAAIVLTSVTAVATMIVYAFVAWLSWRRLD